MSGIYTTMFPNSSEPADIFNHTSGGNNPLAYPDKNELVVVTTILVIIALLGSFFNTFVIASITTGEGYLEAATNWFILSQAFADLFVSISVTPMLIYYFHNLTEKIYLEPYSHLAFIPTIGSLALLMFNRAISVFDPFKYPTWMTARRAIFLLIILWFTGLIAAVFSAIRKNGKCGLCYIRFGRFLGVPILIVIAVCYLYLFCKSRQHQKEIRRQHNALSGQQKSLEQDLKSFRTLVLIVGVHVLCLTPVIVVLIVVDRDKHLQFFARCLAWTVIPVIFNSACANPAIYYLRSKDFRLSLVHFKRYLYNHVAYEYLTQLSECWNRNRVRPYT